MSNYDFNRDLEREQKTISGLAARLRRNPGVAEVQIHTGASHDLAVFTQTGERCFIEVKEDFRCAETGNLAIEYEYRGKPSGISVTRADVWLIRAHTPKGIQNLWVDTKELRKAIKANWYRAKVTGGDEGSNTKMYLFALKDLQGVTFEPTEILELD